jgi:hypothetical protein
MRDRARIEVVSPMGSAMDVSPEVLQAVRKTCLIGAPTTQSRDDA